MRTFQLVCLIVCVLFQLARCDSGASATPAVEEVEDAKLLVVKSILNTYLIEDSDLQVKYDIYNIGNLPALNVKLADSNFPADRFEQVSGFNAVRWSRILPHANVSHVAIVRPKFIGPFNLTDAIVTYLPNEKSQKVQTGHSTEHGPVYVQSKREYNRKFASHTVDWVLFVVMASPSILIPFFLWFSSKSKYERIENAKNVKSN